jgi:hypothetical protein
MKNAPSTNLPSERGQLFPRDLAPAASRTRLSALLAVLCGFAVLLCSCASSTVKNRWKSPELRGPVGKLAVLAIEERGLLRQGIENRFVEQLTKDGAGAVPSYDLLSLPRIKQGKRAAADRLNENGAKALILVRLIDKTSSYREIMPGNERYAATVTGWETVGWYDYFSLGLMSLSSTYATMKEYVYLETSVYDLKTEKRLWSVLTRTVVTENMDRIAELDPLIASIVAAMKTDGVIP